jgi:hypothetical protein
LRAYPSRRKLLATPPMRRALRMLFYGLTVVACSDAETLAVDRSGSRDAGADAGSSGGAGSGGTGLGAIAGEGDYGGAAACPAEPPTDEAACQTVSGSCIYGSSPDPYCRQVFNCRCGADAPDAGCSWRTSQRQRDLCAANNVLTCSDDVWDSGDAGRTPCDPALKNSRCGHADGWICLCSDWRGCAAPCEPLDPPVWYCQPGPVGCPSVIPNAGMPCSEEGERCLYWWNSNPHVATCSKGAWQWRYEIFAP